MIAADSDVCVVLPTRNEESNIVEVLTRLDSLGLCRELVVVDDSDDSTPALAEQLGPALAARVVVHHRAAIDRAGGLATAILAGIDRSESPVVVVMDADLQHPPELVPALVDSLDRFDLAIASRFNWENVIAGLSPARRVASRAAGALAFVMFPRQLANVSDPMSGFFAFQRIAIHVDRLEPRGYKILLEILATHPDLQRTEIPFSFGRRMDGESKAGLAEGLRYLRHLVELRRRASSAAVQQPVPGVSV